MESAAVRSAVVIGGGPAGLAVAAELARRRVRPTVLEAGEAVGWSWRRHYPFLSLHTTRRQSSLPGWSLGELRLRGAGPYPTRDEFAAYLEGYARRLDADIRLGCPVHAVRPQADSPQDDGRGLWEVETAGGSFLARHAVVATGFNRVPVCPSLPGEEAFGGPVLHSSRWAELGEVAGRRVLVVGLGNTGADLVEELDRRGAQVAVAVGGPVHLIPQRLLGVHWRTWYRAAPEAALFLGRLGGRWGRRTAPRAAGALWSLVQRRFFADLEQRGLRLQGGAELVEHWEACRPPLTAGPFVELIRDGKVRVLHALVALHPGEAELADGARQRCDAVVLATGFRPGLEALLGPRLLRRLGVGDAGDDGDFRPPDGRPGPLPGLWFCGYLPELVRIRTAARRIARRVAADVN